MVDLGLDVTEDLNQRLTAVLKVLDSSGDLLKKHLDLLVGTSFDKKIISEQGIKFADNEIARVRFLRDLLIQQRVHIDDTLFAVNYYLRCCHNRRSEGLERVNKSKELPPDYPIVREDEDG